MSRKPLVRMSGLLPSLRDEFKGPFDALFDNFFDSFFKDYNSLQPIQFRRAYPKVDIFREDNNLVFEAAVPGLSKEQLSIDLEDGVLTIKGEAQYKLVQTQEDSEEDRKLVYGQTPYIKELKKSSFLRSFVLPANLGIESIDSAEAKLENGVLTIVFKDVYDECVEKEEKTTSIPIS